MKNNQDNIENDIDYWHQKVTYIGNIAFSKWMDKFRKTMDDRKLVFDEESCKNEALLLAKELRGIIERYSVKEYSDG
ncbi:MAG TPA: hypothetical protein VIH61_03275 [Waddliaceae bacterium]